MNFQNLISSNIGLVHLIFSIIALIMGSVVLICRKGTRFHRKAGYFYTFAMVGMLITAFSIYQLFGGFGIFHFFGLVSTLTLMAGILPMWLKKPKSYISLHFNFMYWSVFGLYGAFVAESLVRIPDIVIENDLPNSVFYNLVGVAVFITMGIGYLIHFKRKKRWEEFH